jgi:hypothetical protein
MASYEYTFQSGESLTPTKLNSARTVSDIVNADISASAAIALSKLATGALPAAITVASTNLVDGTIVNADINANAGIVDTKLATISTALKVANSATTAASANTASAIVARDASGNFAAGTITATLTGTASVATNIAGGSNGSVPYQSGSSTTALLAAGSAGQVLTSNGSNAAPSWQAAANVNTNANNLTGGSAGTVPYQSAAGTTAMLAAGTAGRVLTANGAAAPSWNVAVYPKAFGKWTLPALISATYSAAASGNTVTITATAHGLDNGTSVALNFTSGSHNTQTSGFEGTSYTITLVDANTFTVQKTSVGATSGNVGVYGLPTLVASYNVSSITIAGANNSAFIDTTVNFSSGTFSSANYSVTVYPFQSALANFCESAAQGSAIFRTTGAGSYSFIAIE